jgi:hypothetical protein
MGITIFKELQPAGYFKEGSESSLYAISPAAENAAI